MSQINKAMRGKTAPLTSNKAHAFPRIRPARRRSGNLLVNISIGTRLTLSFMISALIAAIVTGMIGFQHAQSVDKQSGFYLNLLQSNTSLTTGAQFLQGIDSVTQNIVVLVSTPEVSQETLRTNLASLQNLDNLYDGTIRAFIPNQLVSAHPDEEALLDEANHHDQINQQDTLASSASRTWSVTHLALGKFMGDITSENYSAAAALQQAFVQPANADALTSLHSLINFNKMLAGSIKTAADIEANNQLITTIISSVITFIAILFIGWLISGTLVRRLLSLRQVTRAVEHGELTRRVKVIGRDEIADVSASVNAMLDAIANLVNETRSQHDALMNAADHLFSDMRVVSAGDLRVNAPVSNDPIGMLANAFNFTIGRFRRFVLRTKTLSEQLNVIAHRETERADAFLGVLQSIQPSANSQPISNVGREFSGTRQEKRKVQSQIESQTPNAQLMAQVRSTREQLKHISQEGILNHTHVAQELHEQFTQALNRLSAMARGELVLPANTSVAAMTNIYVQELRTLDTLRARMAMEIQNVQKNAVRGFQDLDHALQQLSQGLRQPQREGVETGLSVIAEEDPRLQDLLRLGFAFANEITTLSRQLVALAQETQNSIVSFQFENAETLNGSLPLMLTK